MKTFDDSGEEEVVGHEETAISEEEIKTILSDKGSMTVEELRSEIRRRLSQEGSAATPVAQGEVEARPAPETETGREKEPAPAPRDTRKSDQGSAESGATVRIEGEDQVSEPDGSSNMQKRLNQLEAELGEFKDIEDRVGQLKGRIEELSERERELETGTTGELQAQVKRLESRLSDLEGGPRDEPERSFDISSIKSRLSGLEEQVRPEDIQEIRKEVRSLDKRLGDSRDYTQFKQRLEDALNELDGRKPSESEVEKRIEQVSSRMEDEMDALSSNLQDDIERTREEIRSNTDDRLSDLKGRVEQNSNRTEGLRSRIDSQLKPEIQSLRESYEALAGVDSQVESMEEEMDSLKTELENQRDDLRNEFKGRIQEVEAQISDLKTGRAQRREKSLQRLDRVQDQLKAVEKDIDSRPEPIPRRQGGDAELAEIEQLKEEMDDLKQKVEASGDPAPSAIVRPGSGATIVD